MRLICLPYAGAGASAYRQWRDCVPDDVEVLSVQLPGRESRFREPCASTVEQVIPPLLEALAPLLDVPFVVFGHSLGSALAADLTHALTERGMAPRLLAVSGRRGPHLASERRTHTLDDAAFRKELATMGGTPPEILEHEELMELLTPMLRADFQMAESFVRPDVRTFSCPILAFAGEEDPEALPDLVETWRVWAGSGFRLHRFPGDHFFLHSHRAALVQEILQAADSGL
jgi:medium-chain acyl-[acyl-carrier-protein] hydrolase